MTAVLVMMETSFYISRACLLVEEQAKQISTQLCVKRMLFSRAR